MIIFVGYRVKSKRVIVFRTCANKVLKEYLSKVIKKSITDNLKDYTNVYINDLIKFFGQFNFIKSLIDNGFLNDKVDNIELSYFIDK